MAVLAVGCAVLVLSVLGANDRLRHLEATRAPHSVFSWTQAATRVPPAARGEHAMVYDSRRMVLVLFGGHTVLGELTDETWEFDGTNWVQRHPVHSPSRRYRISMAYDGARGVTVLYGGSRAGDLLTDTWAWNGEDWTRLDTATFPSARSDSSMAYDAARARIVLFGGINLVGNSGTLADMWEWDGFQWTRVWPDTSPPARYGHVMAFDSKRSRVVLFGGDHVVGGQPLNDTWEWDGTTWIQARVTGPGPEYDGGLVFDSNLGLTLLFESEPTQPFETIWSWNGMAWTSWKSSPGPTCRSGAGIAFSSALGKTVLFGGLQNNCPRSVAGYQRDTWLGSASG